MPHSIVEGRTAWGSDEKGPVSHIRTCRRPAPSASVVAIDWLQALILEGVAHLHNSPAGSTVPGEQLRG